MAEIKSLLAEHTYDRLDISIRRMDTDLQRMEVSETCTHGHSSKRNLEDDM